MKKMNIEPQFSLHDLNDDFLIITYVGLCRKSEELVYFDRLKGDVLSDIDGYLFSYTEDKATANQKLFRQLTYGEPTDNIDEERYVLIDRLRLSEFIQEYKVQTRGKEPFNSFVEYFSEEIEKKTGYPINELSMNQHIQGMFNEIFGDKYAVRFNELKNDYLDIYDRTVKALALNWINRAIFNS